MSTHVNLFGLGNARQDPEVIPVLLCHRAGGGERPAPDGAPRVLQAVAGSFDLISLEEATLTASSANSGSETVQRLRDGNPGSFWHVALAEVGKPASVTIDFGPGGEQIVRGLAALPRNKMPRQFLRQAEFYGSNDGENWKLLAEIALPESPEQPGWRKWSFVNELGCRYYRLRILQGHEDGPRQNFYSLAELALFE